MLNSLHQHCRWDRLASRAPSSIAHTLHCFPAEAQIQATAAKLVQWTTARLAWLADQFVSVAQGGAGGSTLQLPASVVAAGASTAAGTAAAPAPPASVGTGSVASPPAAPGAPTVSSFSSGTVSLLG